jgi:hypothetical protein
MYFVLNATLRIFVNVKSVSTRAIMPILVYMNINRHNIDTIYMFVLAPSHLRKLFHISDGASTVSMAGSHLNKMNISFLTNLFEIFLVLSLFQLAPCITEVSRALI